MFTKASKYAIRTVLFMLGKENTNIKKHTVVIIAKALSIPQPYLSKILQQLSKSKIISSSKGRGGGFYLSEANKKKSIIDIIICIDGHNVFDKCILGLPNCGNANPCHFHKEYSAFKENLKNTITDLTIKELHEKNVDNFFTV